MYLLHTEIYTDKKILPLTIPLKKGDFESWTIWIYIEWVKHSVKREWGFGWEVVLLFHFPWEDGSDRTEGGQRYGYGQSFWCIGFETKFKPRDRRRQIHGRLFPLVTWALLTTQWPNPNPSLFLSLSFSLTLLPTPSLSLSLSL